MNVKRVYYVAIAGLLSLTLSCTRKTINDTSDQYGFNEKYEATIDSVLALLSLDEKVSMIYGNSLFTSPGIERLGIPDLHYADGPTGVREELHRDSWQPLGWTTDSVTFFPTGTALAATWNRELAYRYGLALGDEARARNKDVILGPGVNIIRTPLCGRNFEYFSEDPLLASAMTVGYVKGVQMQDVAACVKHYTVNNQEFMRGWINVEMDERTLREIYLPVYKAAAIDAEAYSFMGAYNRFRGQYLCENDYLQNQVLKDEWGYKGMIISDWGATHSTVNTALNGLDVEMGRWGERSYLRKVNDSVRAGLVPESVIDDKVKRILRVIYNVKAMDSTRNTGGMNNPENSQLAYDVAAESIVLLKNDEGQLPLHAANIKTMAVIGMMADKINAKGGFTAGVKARYEITPLEGLKNKVGDHIDIRFAPGYEEYFTLTDTGGRWPWRRVSTLPNDTLIEEAVALAKASNQVLLFVGNPRSVETEATDRESLTLPFGQDSLIQAVTAVNPNTVIVVVAGAACDLSIASQHTSSLVYAWYNGSESGKALADVLFGDVNPSGKLPFTIPGKLDDIGAHAFDKHSYPGVHATVEYKEGILVGYRWLDTKKITPAYSFGYGLSYTTFSIEKAKTNKKEYTDRDEIELALAVKNTGPVAGKETVQVYVRKTDSLVPRADKELKGFSKLEIAPGKTIKTTVSIPVEDLAYFDGDKMQWIVEPGDYVLLVGNSSGNISHEIEIRID